MGRCPFCGCPNNWKICNKCGEVYCNSCGNGEKVNDGSKTTQKAPPYAK